MFSDQLDFCYCLSECWDVVMDVLFGSGLDGIYVMYRTFDLFVCFDIG